jgi:hypothetical protein
MSCVWRLAFDWKASRADALGGCKATYVFRCRGDFFFFLLDGIKRKGTHFGACSCFSPFVIGVSSFDVHDVLRNTAAAVAS